LGLKGTRQQGSGEDFIIRSLMICTPHTTLFGVIKSRKMRWAGHVALWGRGIYGVLVGKPEGK